MREINTIEPTKDSSLRSSRSLRRIQTRNAMALVGIMLVLMLILAASLIGFASMSGKGSGDIGHTSSNIMQMTQKRMNIQAADNLADAGFRAASQWITDLAGPPLNTTAFTPITITPNEFYADSGRWDSGNWTWVNFPDSTNAAKGQFRVRFYPHADNTTAAQRAYLVEAIGVYNGETRVVRADIQQNNFAQYAYFTDDIGSGLYWIAGRTTFNGPVHINNATNADINIVWDSTSSRDVSQIFQWNGDNAFTMWKGTNNVNATKVKWSKDTTGNTTAPSSDNDWMQVIKEKTVYDASGNATGVTKRTGPTMVSDKVAMPTSSTQLRDAALGTIAESSYTASGVYVPSTNGANAATGTPIGGIYIKGQVDDMVMEASGTGNRDQTIYIYQGATTNGTVPSKTKWVVTMAANGTTTLNKFTRTLTTSPFSTTPASGYPKVYTGSPTNGVIYSYDNVGWSNNPPTTPRVGGLSGTIANSATDGSGNVSQLNKMTIATRVESGSQRNLNIDGNILYANASSTAAQAPADAGVLGIVAGYIRIIPTAEVVEPAITGFKYRATAEDGAYTDGATLDNLSVHGTMLSYNTIDVDNYNSRPKGQFRLLGGYIAKSGTSFGQVNGGTGTDAFDVKYGFQRILSYDKRVANQPPPYFPGTGQAYQILSYQRLNAPLQP